MTVNDKRLDLQWMLEQVLGSRNVYFQPPDTVRMKYPAIVYELNDIRNKHADNSVYLQSHVYRVTIIDKDPDSDIVERFSKLPRVKFIRPFVSDNLYHKVFEIYY